MLARLIGLAQVVVQSAGGSDSHLRLAFLSLPRAEQLRDELLVLAGRSDEVAHPGPSTPTASRTAPATGQPSARHGLRHPRARGPQRPPLRRDDPAWVDDRPRRAGPGGARWHRARRGRPARPRRGAGPAPHRHRRRRQPGQGAADPRQLPPRRHRHRGARPGGAHRPAHDDDPAAPHPGTRARAAAVVASRGAGGASGSTSPARTAADGDESRETTLLPVGTLDDSRLVLAVVAPGLAPALWDDAALGDGPEPGWRPVSSRTRALDPLSWRRNAWTVDPSAVLLRSGRLTRRAVAVPHARVQSLDPATGLARAPPPGGDRAGGAGPRTRGPRARAPRGRGRRGVPRRGLAAGPCARDGSARSDRPSLAPDPPGLVDWTRHLQGTPDDERS